MKAVANELGRAAVSMRGHDKGRVYLVVRVLDERYVLVSDGATRRLDHPKKKQVKHLRALPFTAEEIARALAEGGTPQDSDIRKALISLPGLEDRPVKAGDVNKEECVLVQN